MRNVLDKIVEKIKTQILCSITFSENRDIYEIMSKHMVEPEATSDVTVWRIHIAWWISKTIRTHRACTRPRTHTRTYALTRTHTHTNIIVIAFARQQ